MEAIDLIPTLTALSSVAGLIAWLRHLTASDRHHLQNLKQKD